MIVAMAQIHVEPGCPEANLETITDAIAEAGSGGADAVVLPECADIGWMDRRARDLAEPIPGPVSERIRRSAARAGVVVVVGLVERLEGGALANSAVVIDRDGSLCGVHRKIAVLDIAGGLYRSGRALTPVATSIGVVAPLICADNFPENLVLARAMARMGAQIVLSPCSWAVQPDYDNAATPYGSLWTGAYTQIAAQTGLATAGVSGVGWIQHGSWAGWPVIGNSIAVGPDGRLLHVCAHGPDSAELAFVEISVTDRAPA